MATDGSIKFDTAINVDGFEEGISTLSKAMESLTKAVERLSDNLHHGFQIAGTAAETASDKTDTATKSMEDMADKTKKAEEEAARLKKQMDQIEFHSFDEAEAEPDVNAQKERTVPIENPENFSYDQSAMEFIENYEKKTEQAEQKTNEFRQLLESLQRDMKAMEERGLYFGDEEYDKAFLEISKVKQALADYKREIVSPTPDSVTFPADSIQGQIERLKKELSELSSQGKTFGDSVYDSTYQALKKAQEELKSYQKDLTEPKELRIVLDEGTLQGRIEHLKQQLESLDSQGKTFGDGVYDSTYQALIRAKEELKQYKKDLEAPVKMQIQLDPASFAGQIQSLKERLEGLSSHGITMGMPEYDQTYMQLQKVMAAQKQYEAYLKNLAVLSEQSGASIAGEGDKAGMTAEQMENLARKKAYATRENKSLGSQAADTGKSLKKEGKHASWLSKMLGVAGKKMVSLGKQALKSRKQSKTGDQQTTKMLGRMVLLSMVHRAISGITRAFKEGIQNYAGYSDSFNTVMSSFVSSLEQLKNSLASSFAPITSIAVPALDALIQKFVQLINIAGQFLAALGGKGTFSRAVKVNKDYAESLKQTGGAAKKAGEDAKRSLAPFDDLIQVQKQGADASGGASGAIDPSQMFEEVAIDENIGSFAGRLKELFEADDWAGIGRLLGERINEQIAGATEYVDWDNCGEKISATVNRFTTMFNEMVRTIDWYQAGVLFGAGIDTVINTLYLLAVGIDWSLVGQAFGDGLNGMVDRIDWMTVGLLFAAGLNGLVAVAGNAAATFDWSGFGSSLALSLSTFFQNFDWGAAGTLVSDVVLGLLDAFITFLEETDWTAFGEGIAEFFLNIDWLTIVNRIYEAFGAALGTVFGSLAGLLGKLISEGVEKAKDYFGKTIDECGGNVALGILVGIGRIFAGIHQWIIDNMFRPFIDGFLKAFGIEGGTSALEQYGEDLWNGFCKGVEEFFSDPVSFIREKITDPFVNGIKGLLGIHSPSTVLEGIGSNTVQGFNQGVTKEQASSQNVVQSWASGVASWFSSKFGIGSGSGDAKESQKWASSIMSGFNNKVKKNYTESKAVMELWAENARKWFVGEDKDSGVNMPSWEHFAASVIQAFCEKIEGSSTETKAPMENWSGQVREWFWGGSDLESGGLYEAFYQMAKRINEGFADGISYFSYMAKDAIEQWAREAMEAAREEFDIHSPSREFRTIAEYVIRGFNQGIESLAGTSRGTVQRWLDGILDVFDGVDVNLPIGIDLPDPASYLPKMSFGTVVPPRAGEAAALARSGSYGQETELGELLARIEELIERTQESDGRPIQIFLNLTGNLAALARILKPELDKETARKGVKLVITGGS